MRDGATPDRGPVLALTVRPASSGGVASSRAMARAVCAGSTPRSRLPTGSPPGHCTRAPGPDRTRGPVRPEPASPESLLARPHHVRDGQIGARPGAIRTRGSCSSVGRRPWSARPVIAPDVAHGLRRWSGRAAVVRTSLSASQAWAVVQPAPTARREPPPATDHASQGHLALLGKRAELVPERLPRRAISPPITALREAAGTLVALGVLPPWSRAHEQPFRPFCAHYPRHWSSSS